MHFTLKAKRQKSERLNYILMSSVRSISAAIHLSKTLLNQLIQIAANQNNWNSGINDITPYELVNYAHLDFSHLKMIGSQA